MENLSNQKLDNYGKPRQLFIDKCSNATDEQLYELCNQHIWLSAYASNNRRSDYHWMCDATYDECKKRGKIEEIYTRAWQNAQK